MTDSEQPKKTSRAKKVFDPLPDFLGTTLAIDDMVGFSHGSSTIMTLGRVLGFTAKTIRVEIIRLPNGGFDGYTALTGKPLTRFPNQVVKLPINIQEFNYLPKEWITQVFS